MTIGLLQSVKLKGLLSSIASFALTFALLALPAGVANAVGAGQITTSITGGPANTSVDISVNQVVGTVTTDSNGSATYTASGLVDGSYSIGASIGTFPYSYQAAPSYGNVIDGTHQSRSVSLSLQQLFTGNGQVTSVPNGTQSLSFAYSSSNYGYFLPNTNSISAPNTSQSFGITGLTNGTWTVSVSADSGAAGSSTFTVANGEITSPLVVPLQATQTISGIIRDSDGNPLENVEVAFNKFGNSSGDACDGPSYCTAITDVNGEYSISGVSYNSVRPQLNLDLTMNGFTAAAIYSMQNSIAVSALTPADLTFPLGSSSVSGVVQEDITSSNISGANINGSVFLGSSSISFSATSDSQGRYQIPKMPNGSANISASKYGNSSNLYLNFNTSFQINNENKTKNIYLIPTPTGTSTLSGQVVNTSSAGINSAYVNLNNVSNGAYYSQSTDGNGDYSISSLPAGVYRIGVSAQNKKYYSGSVTIGNAANVTRNVTLQSIPTGTAVVSGVVRDTTTNLPVSGASIGFSNMGLGFFNTTTAADGSWSVSGVADGTYNFWLNGPQGSTSYDYSEREELVVSGGINVVRNDGLRSLVAGTSSVNGTLKNSITHEPLTGVTIAAYRTSGNFAVEDVLTNSRGEFTLNGLPDGQYSIMANVEGYFADVAPNDEGSEQGGGFGGPGIAIGIVDLEPGESARFYGKVTPMALGNSTISGLVQTSAGRAVEGAWVNVSTLTGAHLGGTQTDELGHYSISGLPVGAVVVSASSPSVNYSVTEQSSFLSSSGSIVDLILANSGLISGTVKDQNGNAVPCAVLKAYRVNNDNSVGNIVSAVQSDSGDTQGPGDGSYSLSHLSPGEYYVRLGQECWNSSDKVTTNFATSFWSSTAAAGTESAIQKITVTAGAVAADKDFVVSNSGGALSGSVGIQTAAGVANIPLGKYAVASIYKLVSGSYVVQGYLTTWLSGRDGGNFQFNGIAPGSYKVKFTDPMNSSRGFETTFAGGSTLNSATVFTVTAGSTQSIPQIALSAKVPSQTAESVSSGALTAPLEDQIDAPNNVVANQVITVDVGKDMAGEWVSVWAHSTPTSLGDWVQVRADGTVSATISEALPSGNHRIVVQDIDNNVVGWTGTSLAAPPEGSSSTGGTVRKTVSSVNNIGTVAASPESLVTIAPKKSIPNSNTTAKAASSSETLQASETNFWVFGGLAALLTAGIAGGLWLFRSRRD